MLIESSGKIGRVWREGAPVKAKIKQEGEKETNTIICTEERAITRQGTKERGNSNEKINNKQRTVPTFVFYRHYLNRGFPTLLATAALLFRERKTGDGCESTV